VICGTRGVPDTVAPFRAWRGSRDLVAQSPKLHAMAVAEIRATATFSLTHRRGHGFKSASSPRAETSSKNDREADSQTESATIMALSQRRPAHPEE
jgi:hypothetical protein